MNVAIIIAGGVGSRMNMDIPKQFIHIYGKPVIIRRLTPSRWCAWRAGRSR